MKVHGAGRIIFQKFFTNFELEGIYFFIGSRHIEINAWLKRENVSWRPIMVGKKTFIMCHLFFVMFCLTNQPWEALMAFAAPFMLRLAFRND